MAKSCYFLRILVKGIDSIYGFHWKFLWVFFSLEFTLKSETSINNSVLFALATCSITFVYNITIRFVQGSPTPKILYKTVQSLKFGEIVRLYQKTVTLPKQLLYITCDFTCDHVICRPYRTLIHGNLWKNFWKFTEKW